MHDDVTQGRQPAPSLVARLLARVGNPRQWSLADRCLLASLISLFFSICFIFVMSFVLLPNLGIAPWFNRAAFQSQLKWHLLIFIGGWSSITVAALLARWRAPNNRLLVHAVCQLFGIGFAYTAYDFGTATSALTPLVLLAGAFVGYALFDKLPPTLGVASFFAVSIAATIAAQLEWIPYAPFFIDAPFKNGRLDGSWLTTLGGLSFGIFVYVVGLLYFIIDRWHDSETKLAQTSEQLARANDLISRYVAQQVAEQIQLGNYDAIDRQYRRRLTLFFSDIKGFTEVADHVEPEEVSELLNEYFTEMTVIAGQFGGTIDKFMGDAIMIFFGAPVATHDEDHALRAVRMAMAMQGRMKELHRRWEKRGITEPFQVRMGINTGVASVGNFGAPGRMDYTAIGRQVNLAARLQVNCEPGKVLLSHATWVFVRDEIPCEPKGEIQVKGIRDPVNVYEVTAPYPIEEPTPESLTSGAAA
jgi:class 3 adenylate cyclase